MKKLDTTQEELDNTVIVDGLEIPEPLLPHAFLSNCHFCGRSIELEFTLKELVKCPYCSMILSSPPGDRDLISMMGGRSALLRTLDLFKRQEAIKKESKDFQDRIYQESNHFKARLASQNQPKNKFSPRI